MNFLKGKDFLNYYELGLYLNNLGYDLNLKDIYSSTFLFRLSANFPITRTYRTNKKGCKAVGGLVRLSARSGSYP